jgi:hypothetical protein
MFATAGMLTAVQSSVATAGAVSHVTRVGAQAPGQCDVVLPGGLKAAVSVQNGHLTARPADPAPAKGGVMSFNVGGHQYLLTQSALRDVTNRTADLSAYDTTRLAESACGIPDPAQSDAMAAGMKSGRPAGEDLPRKYKLHRLTVHALDVNGKPTDQPILVVNVDDERLASSAQVSSAGVAKFVLPEGHYAAFMADNGALTSTTFVFNPEFTFKDDSSLTLDLRDATSELTLPQTPRPATLESWSWSIGRSDGVHDGNLVSFFGLGTSLPVMHFNPTGTVEHGKFTFDPVFDLSSPASATEPYQYHIAEPTDHIPASFPAKVDASSLATVKRDYGAPSVQVPVAYSLASPMLPWQAETSTPSAGGFSLVSLGTSRTEYFTGTPLWQSAVDGDDNGRTIYTPYHRYEAGTTTVERLQTGPQHPTGLADLTGTGQTCSACASGGALQLAILPLNDNNPGDYGFDRINDPLEPHQESWQLRRDGELLADEAGEPFNVTVSAPAGKARYQLTEKLSRSITATPLNTGSQTTWTFNGDSAGDNGALPANWKCLQGTGCTALPLLYPYYSADATLMNNLVPGTHTLTVKVDHQQYSVAPAIAGAEVAFSYDDGANWQPATLTGSDGQYRASFTVPANGTNGYVAIRFSAWDKDGNRIDQTMLRSYTTR